MWPVKCRKVLVCLRLHVGIETALAAAQALSVVFMHNLAVEPFLWIIPENAVETGSY